LKGPLPSAQAANGRGRSAMAKPYKVWVVDDDPDRGALLSTYLQGHWYDVR